MKKEEKIKLGPQRNFKICQIALSLGKGGAERFCAMLSETLKNKGYDIHTVILTDEIDYAYSGKLFNLGKLKSEKDTFLSRLSRFKKLRKYLKANQFDVIIDHRPKNDYLRELFYDRYLYRRIPRIYLVQNSNQENYFTPQPKKMAKIYNKNLANVGVSKYIEKEVMKKLGVKKTVTIHNAFDPFWNSAKVEISKDLKNRSYLLWYGRLHDAHKDISFLLKAFQFSEVWKEGIQLFIVGKGNDEEKLKKKAAVLPCAGHIEFLPFTNNPFSYIVCARAVALTSNYEGFPLVLVESLSVGTPVVSLDIISGPSEVIKNEKNGLLVPERGVNLFAEALRKICFDEKLHQTCKTNAKNSVEKFSMKNIGEKWDKLLQKVLG